MALAELKRRIKTAIVDNLRDAGATSAGAELAAMDAAEVFVKGLSTADVVKIIAKKFGA